jgi:hypothetical protein
VFILTDDEVVKLILKEIEIYLQFDLMQREYAKKGIKNALKKMKRSAPDSLQTKGSTQQ